ncbi:putative internal virion D [Pseudomonas phage LUZ100]|nr:putative internal virion D [Pseudomonas phage LUZ100]
MAVYEIGGARYELPDDLQGDQLNETLMYLSQAEAPQEAAPAPTDYQYGAVAEDIDPDTLASNQDWLNASRVLYQMNEGQPFQGSDQELAEWGLDMMGWFNYNLPVMAVDAAKIGNAEQYEKDAFLYLMDSYDNLNVSWEGAGRFFKGVLTDPTTYVGLGTLGVGLAGKEGAKQATKAGVRELLKAGLKTGTVAGVEGAMYGAVDNTIRQSIEVSAGRKEEIDGTSVLGSAALGAGVGLAGGTVLSAVSDSLANKWRNFRAGPEETLPVPVQAAPEAQPKAAVDSAAPTTPDAAPTPSQPAQLEAPPTDLVRVAPGTDAAIPAREGELIFNRTLEQLNTPELDNQIPFVPRNMDEVTQFAESLAEDLRDLHYTQVEDIVDQLRTTKMTQAEWGSFNRSTQIAVDQLRVELARVIKETQGTTDPEKLYLLGKQQEKLERLLSPVAAMDEAFSSLTGSMLRQRQEGLTALRGLSPEELAKQGMTKEAADAEYARRVDAVMESAEFKQKTQEYDSAISAALAKGDVGEAARLTVIKQEELAIDAESAAGTNPGFIRKANELIISNVFSMTTLMVNAVPSMAKVLYRPTLNAALSNPFEKATRREMMATYSAMRSATGGAWRAAKAAFRYEQAILTRESGRLLEGELAIKGLKGGVIRMFPRLLNASDEFMSRITYEGFIAGKVANDAFEEGERQGLKGKALNQFVKTKVREAIEASYANPTAQENLNVVLNKGRTLGYSGQKLINYVQREVARDPEALRHGHDSEAIDYVRDVLYKRAFSGEGFASSTAKRYEDWVNEHPIVRLMGQLFFRTPVRVFEEGMRMTPGVQVLAPGFIRDLRGLNGRRAQMRAQGEAMMSLAATSAVLTLYAQGRITGDGAYSDWRQQRARGDSDLPEPYTIRFDDGSTWSYRNFDPLATPLKIMINGLERYENLVRRERQGEFVAKTEWDRAKAAVSVGTGAIAQAIRDANLMAGVDAMLTLGEDATDPEKSDAAMLKFLGEKLRTLVPNTMQKIAKTNDPTIDDPTTFWQMVESKVLFGGTLGAYERSAPKSYDFLGNVRQMGDEGAMWNIFSLSTPEERAKGMNEQQLDVLRKLDYISKQTGTTFAAPNKHRLMGNTDLRKTLTADGQESLYDRWQRYYKEQQPEVGLSQILNAGLPVGTQSISGPVVQQVNRYINSLRDAAFYRLMAEEAGVQQGVIQNLHRKAEVKAGFWDQ